MRSRGSTSARARFLEDAQERRSARRRSSVGGRDPESLGNTLDANVKAVGVHARPLLEIKVFQNQCLKVSLVGHRL
jgi:hypothetical protein